MTILLTYLHTLVCIWHYFYNSHNAPETE